MGNRAVLCDKEMKHGIYLHWNGGTESVLAFLDAARTLGIRDPISDPDYAYARMAQMIGNWFGGTTSIGVGDPSRMDDSDNGRYIIGSGFTIAKRTKPDKSIVDMARVAEMAADVFNVNRAIFLKD